MIKQALNWLKNDFKELDTFIRSIPTLIIFHRYKRKALRLHKKYNVQVFVVKIEGKVEFISKYQFKNLRQRGHINYDFDASKLKEISIYYTPKFYPGHESYKARTTRSTR